jgi:hypothetical protein
MNKLRSRIHDVREERKDREERESLTENRSLEVNHEHRNAVVSILADSVCALLPTDKTEALMLKGAEIGMYMLQLFTDREVCFQSLFQSVIPRVQPVVTARFGHGLVVRWIHVQDPLNTHHRTCGSLVLDWSDALSSDDMVAADHGRITALLRQERWVPLCNRDVRICIASTRPVHSTTVTATIGFKELANPVQHAHLRECGFADAVTLVNIDDIGYIQTEREEAFAAIQTEIRELEREFIKTRPLWDASRPPHSHIMAGKRLADMQAQLKQIEDDLNMRVVPLQKTTCRCRHATSRRNALGVCMTCSKMIVDDISPLGFH